MTWKIFSAYLKGLSKYRRMAFFFLNNYYLFSFLRYWHFSIMQIRSAMTSYCLLLKMIKYFIKSILKSLVVPVIWLAQIGAIYSQIAPVFALNHIIFPANEEVTLQTCGCRGAFVSACATLSNFPVIKNSARVQLNLRSCAALLRILM